MISFREFAEVAERLWPLAGADDWDRPGLAIGKTGRPIERVLLAVDFTKDVLEEAKSLGASLIFTHHPPILRGVTEVSDRSEKGQLVIDALDAGVAVFSAHTNADIVREGVSDTLARRLGLLNIEPMLPAGDGFGHGRIGSLPEPVELKELVDRLAALLPDTTRGIACSGTPAQIVSRIALCGGAGDSFIQRAIELNADVYITSDLRHHVTQESSIPLVDVSHWASESLWLPVAASQLAQELPKAEFIVSKVKTDPWNFVQRSSR